MGDSDADFRKFIKFFTTRLVQTLVQARLGEPIETKCSVTSDPNDWFNVHVDELGEISAYMKSNIKKLPPDSKLGIEFILYTAEGKHLPLEAWIISVTPEREPTVNVKTDLYYQMSTLLRSAAVASRMTPMHRLYVKQQHEDSYIILYRIIEVTSPFDMGPKSVEKRLGRLPSPSGTLCLDVVYRTVMQLDASTETIPAKESCEVLTDQSMNYSDCIPISKGDEKECTSPMSEGMLTFKSHQSPMDDSKDTQSNSSVEGPGAKFHIGKSTSSEEFSGDSQEQPILGVEDCRPFMAELRNNSFPFARLLHSAYSEIKETKSSVKLEEKVNEPEKPKEPENKQEEKEEEPEETEDSFVKICDFGTSSLRTNDVAELIKQLRTAPDNLKTCSQAFSTFEDLKLELEHLTDQSENFDKFVENVKLMSEDD